MGLFDNLGWQVAQKAASRIKIPSVIRENSTSLRKLIRGDLEGVASDVINKKFGLIPALGSFGSNLPPFGTANQVIGGISISDYRNIFEQANNTEYAKGNLWAISVTDLKQSDGATGQYVNFFATDVQYAAYDGAGNAQRTNSGFFDIPENRNPTEFQITTLDDSEGTIKKWFEDRFSRVFKPDGTHGLPIDYLMLVEVQHAIVDGGMNSSNSFITKRICRAGRMDNSLARRDDVMEEVNFTLVQHDSFIPTS